MPVATDVTITPTGGALGAIATNLDASQPVSPALVLRLKQALRDHHILIFKNQRLSEAQLFEFATYFGDLFVPPENVPVLGSKLGEIPVVVTIANAAPEYGTGALLDNAELLPHSDHQWAPRPSSGSLLYALDVPEDGGDTQWVNLVKAYAALDEATQQAIANLQLVTYNPFRRDPRSGNGVASYRQATAPSEEPLFPHPLVRTHPESGKKSLYLDCAYEVEVVGMEAQSGATLIEQLRRHINQAQFYYNHQWSRGDVVYWDNQCTLHYRPAFAQNAKRVMKRVSLAGSRPFETERLRSIGSLAAGKLDMDPIYFTYLNGLDIAALAIADDEILTAVEAGLRSQALGETVIEPRVHLEPDPAFNGHFNILRGYIAPLDVAGVKIVGDYVDNYKRGLPSEMALLNLFDPRTGMPVALLDATAITEMRTGAMTAIGAKYLARRNSQVLGHIGARGTAYWNVRLLDRLFDFAEIRVHSRRLESRQAFAAKLSQDLGKPVIVTDDWEACVRGADIVVEASRLNTPTPLLKTEWIQPGAFVVPYGTMSAVELSLTEIMDKIVVDDWGQCKQGKFGSLRAHVEIGRLAENTLHAELGAVVAGRREGRTRDEETILLWHRGLSISDIALGQAMLAKAKRLGIGQQLRYC